MANSYALQRTLVCPACGSTSNMEVWTIIDEVERPDLIQQVLTDSIHSFACKNGHTGAVDAPLLVINKNALPPLVYSPQERVGHDDNTKAFLEILRHLRDSLGSTWRSDWIPNGLQIVLRVDLSEVLKGERIIANEANLYEIPNIDNVWEEIARVFASEELIIQSESQVQHELEIRPRIRAKLRAAIRKEIRALVKSELPEDEQDQLRRTITAFLNAMTWGESFRLLTLHPELSTDQIDNLLGRLISRLLNKDDKYLASQITGSRNLLTRSRVVGPLQAVAEESGYTVEQFAHEAELQSLCDLQAVLIAERVETLSDEDLMRAMEQRPALAGKLLATWTGESEMLPRAIRGPLGEALGLTNPSDATLRIALLRETIGQLSGGHADQMRASLQNELGNTLLAEPLHSNREQTERNIEEAIDAYRSALEVYTRTNHPVDWAMTQNNLGNAYSLRLQGEKEANLESAISAFNLALEIRTRETLPVDWAATKNNLGSAYIHRVLGDKESNLEEAITAFKDALQVRTREDFPEDWAATQFNLGSAYLQRIGGDRAANLEYAIAAFEASLKVRTPETSLQDWSNSKKSLGAVYAQRQHGDLRLNLESALAANQAVLDKLIESFQWLAADSMADQQAKWESLFAETVTLLTRLGRGEEAMALAETAKSRWLMRLFSRSALPAPGSIPLDLLLAERQHAAALTTLDITTLTQLGETTHRSSKQVKLQNEKRETEAAELRYILNQMELFGTAAKEYVRLIRGYQPSWDDVVRISTAQGPDTGVISLFDTGDQTIVFLARAGSVSPIICTMRNGTDEGGISHRQATMLEYVDNFIEEVLARTLHRGLGRPYTHRWRKLGLALFGPLRSHIVGLRHLTIIPHDIYHLLPLHALWLSNSRDTLIDHCSVSYVPAVGLLERLGFSRGAVGSVNTASSAPSEIRSAVLGFTEADPLTALGMAERETFLGEASEVAKEVGATLRIDSSATGEALTRIIEKQLKLLHLSCHGYFDDNDPLDSGVILTDGVFTGRQFMNRRMQVELVTLSACETGMSASMGGDERVGLSTALLASGAESLVLALWRVNAHSTRKFMVDFYRRLWQSSITPVGKAEALRQTMLAMRNGRLMHPVTGFDPSDPYYWAPFVLVGDWR